VGGGSLQDGIVDGLESVPSLRLIPQGTGAQTDLRLRGSSFSETGLSLSGLALRVPQTGHFNTELPLSAALFSTPDVLTGIRQVQDSTGHFAGSVAADFAPITQSGRVETGIGERGTNWQSALYSSPIPGSDGWGGTVFASRSDVAGMDYNDNDAYTWNAGAHAQHLSDTQQFDLAAGYQSKQFGARGFYGADASYPSEEDLEDTLILASNRWTLDSGEQDYVRATAGWRTLYDHYVYDRDDPSLYENWHRSTVSSTAVDGFSTLTERTGMQWRLEAESETLNSTRFGDYGRRRAGLTLLPKLTLGALTLDVGGRSLWFSDESPALCAVGGIQYALSETQSVYFSYVESVRQPSYTELYYSSTSSIGNPDLDLQRGREFEVGWTGKLGARTTCRTALFSRMTRHTIDWVKSDSDDDAWQATDLGDIDVSGAEVEAAVRAGDSCRLECGYTYLLKSDETDFYASRYVLDYARHHITAGVQWRPHARCELRFNQTVACYEPNQVRTTDSTLAYGVLEASYLLPGTRSTKLVFCCENVWNDQFEIIAGQEAVGRYFALMLSTAW